MWSVPSEAIDGQAPVKFRQACDPCTTAKVKCDSGRPCQRCVDGEQVCQYSASRRYGKRAKRTKPKDDGRQAGAFSNASNCGEMAGNGFDASDTNVGTAAPFGTVSGLDLCSDWPFDSLPLLSNSTNILNTCDQWMESTALASPITSAKAPTSTMSIDALAFPLDRRPSTRNVEHVLACESRAMTILKSLNYCPSLHTAGRQDTLSGSGSTSAIGAKASKPASSVHTMETLLSTNQSALRDLTQMIECGCADDAHIALLHLTILAKVVFWYKVAVTAKYHDESIKLIPMKIQLGMLDLDDDDYENLYRTALLRELHKAVNVVQSIELRCTSNGAVFYKGSSPWRSQTIRIISDELQRIIQENEESHKTHLERL